MEIPSLHNITPLLFSTRLSELVGCNVWLKLENFQSTSSYKLRGIGHACIKALLTEDVNRLVTSGDIDSCWALAYAGRRLNVPTTTFVSSHLSERMRKTMGVERASVIEVEGGFEEAESLAREFVKNTPNSKYIHPYDDPDIWEGISTMINEFSENAPFQCPDAVICPMGGGDLMSGVIEGLRNCGWEKVPVIVAETHQSNSFQASIRAGQSVKLDRPQALIKGLEIRQVCSRALELAFMHPSLPLSVTDSMAADACCKFADDHQMIVDAGTGAALSVLYSRSIQKFLPNLDETMNIVVVITGGVDISLETLIQYKEQYSNPPILVKSDSGVFMRMQDVPDIDSD